CSMSFFFSSRRRHTRCLSDWSSDVCSSDLLAGQRGLILTQHHAIPLGLNVARWPKDVPYSYSSHPEILERAWRNAVIAYPPNQRSEERRVGKECRSRRQPYHSKKTKKKNEM